VFEGGVAATYKIAGRLRKRCTWCLLTCLPPPLQHRTAACASQRCHALPLSIYAQLLFIDLAHFRSYKAVLAIAGELQVEAHADAAAAAARRVPQPQPLLL
jgi:hypothetical protein